MSVTIHLHTDLEKRLQQRAAAEGVHLDDYIVKTLEAQVSSGTISNSKQRELELLQKINLGIPTEMWERYNVLIEKRREELLLPEELEELIEITTRIEAANAERMPYLVELAQLRQVSLETVFQQLGLQN